MPWLDTRLAAHPDLTITVVDVATLDLPLAGVGTKRNPSHAAASLDAADGFIVLTPEYNHSIPAALKNLIDWHATEWARKPVMAVSYGARSGGSRAVEHLRLIFPELQALTTRNVVSIVAPWEHLDTDGRFTPTAEHDGALDASIGELRWWATALRPSRITAG